MMYRNTMLIEWGDFETAEFKGLSPEAAKIIIKGFKENPEWLGYIKEAEWVNEQRRTVAFIKGKEPLAYCFELYENNGVIGELEFHSFQGEEVCNVLEQLYAGEFYNLDWKF
ncbi:MAG: hypothetical protein LUC97_01965 [Clostridiales bacterium]|nr:hypothetical protein [Clostridiales bacterium]